jgi:hypothetical protein
MRPWWWNTVEARDLIGLNAEEQRKQIETIKELNEWNAHAIKLIEKWEKENPHVSS